MVKTSKSIMEKILLQLFTANTVPVGQINSDLLLLRDGALFRISFKDYKAERLTLPGRDVILKPVFDRSTGKVILCTEFNYWKREPEFRQVDPDGRNPVQLTVAGVLTSIENIWTEEYMENLEELNVHSGTFRKSLPAPGDGVLVVEFITLNGYWTNRLLLKTGEMESVLLDYVKNW